MYKDRKAKIVATLGPKTETFDAIEKLFLAGVDVFRLNFSHATHEEHKARYETIRAVEEKYNHPISVLADLQGPKLRVSQFANGKEMLKAGQTFRFDMNKDELGTAQRVCLPHPQIFESLEKGTELLIDDGKLKLVVEDFGKDWAETRVIIGGEISNNKGVNVPNAVLKISALTEKDLKDLDFALSLGVDWIALSFVQKPEDVKQAKEIIGDKAWIISKIEKPSALDHLEEIASLSNACMVARGDLGVEIPAERVPAVQKEIIRTCRRMRRPVVIATQMLDSMIHTPTPTRAEASDVANAIYDGADGVMLSAETTIGDYPFETVDMMSKIIKQVENDPFYAKVALFYDQEAEISVGGAVAAAATRMGNILGAKSIVAFTASGTTALRVSRERPRLPIISLSPDIRMARRLNLVWGIIPAVGEDSDTVQGIVNQGCKLVKELKLAQTGDHFIAVAGVPRKTALTNSLRVATLD